MGTRTHTDKPWTMDNSPEGDVAEVQIFGHAGTLPVLIADVMAEGDAAHILCAVNNIDALIEAGRALYDAIGNLPDGERPLSNDAVLRAGKAWVEASLRIAAA